LDIHYEQEAEGPEQRGGVHDPVEMVKQANTFVTAAQHLYGGFKANLEPEMLSVLIVLHALGCELYLKCVGLTDGKRVPVTHDLQLLFTRLKSETRTELEQRYDAIRAKDPVCQLAVQRVETELGLNGWEFFRLENALEKSKHALKTHRYRHEGNLSDYSVGPLAFAARQVIMDRWEAVYRESGPGTIPPDTPEPSPAQ
jgi:hypothetical protein